MFKNTTNQGTHGLGIAIAYYTGREYIVSLPLNDSQNYDLIAEKNGIIRRIQVKTSFNNSQKRVDVSNTNLKDKNLDTLFVVDQDYNMYEVPICDVSHYKNNISLSFLRKYKI